MPASSPESSSDADVAWQPWSRAAFARARAERKPVLLSIVAAWCDWPAARWTARATPIPTSSRLINERFVPIRVDADGGPTSASATASAAGRRPRS